MDWKKIAPWNWFKEEEAPAVAGQLPARFHTSSDPIAALRSEMSRIFEDSFRRSFPSALWPAAPSDEFPSTLRPLVDVSEGKKAYTVRAELPGIDLENVSIELEDRTLVIRAERRRESDQEEEGYHCIERSYGSIQRVLSLPDDADGEAIEANFKNGVLEIRIPKHAAPASSARRVEIARG